MEFRKVHSYTIAPLSVKTERVLPPPGPSRCRCPRFLHAPQSLSSSPAHRVALGNRLHEGRPGAVRGATVVAPGVFLSFCLPAVDSSLAVSGDLTGCPPWDRENDGAYLHDWLQPQEHHLQRALVGCNLRMAPRKEPCSGGNARPAQPARPSLPAPGAQASRVPSPGHKRDGGVTPARAQALVDGSAEKGGPILPAGGYESLKSPKSMHGGAVTAIKIQPSTGLLYTGGADRLVKVRAPPRPACSPAPRPATPELRPRRREQVWDVFNSEKPPACPPRPPRLPPRPPRFTPRAAGRDARAGRCRCVHAFRAHGGVSDVPRVRVRRAEPWLPLHRRDRQRSRRLEGR